MAADCKSAAPRSYGGSNPPLCTRIGSGDSRTNDWIGKLTVSRFGIAMVIFAVLELLAWETLSDKKVQLIAMAVIAMFALRTWVYHRRETPRALDSSDEK